MERTFFYPERICFMKCIEVSSFGGKYTFTIRESIKFFDEGGRWIENRKGQNSSSIFIGEKI